MEDPKQRLIFALDVSSRKEAERYVDELDGVVDFFKVGIILHTVTGGGFVEQLIKQGKRVFLDLKFYDIPETVRDAVRQTARSGLYYNLLNGRLRRCGRKKASTQGLRYLLTSMDASDTSAGKSSEEIVLERAKLALECGCDGVVASGREAGIIKEATKGNLLVICPGIRPAGTSPERHKRTVTPSDAIKAGADYLVVGRPIKEAVSPRLTAQKIIEEIYTAINPL